MSIFEVPILYNDLVTSTEGILSDFSNEGLINFDELPYEGDYFPFDEPPGPLEGRKYKLSQPHLGDLGKLFIGKHKEDISIVSFDGPPSYLLGQRKPTEQELAEIEAAPNQSKWLMTYLTVQHKIKRESLALYDHRKELLADVRKDYFTQLRQENIWLPFQVTETEAAPFEIIEEVQESIFRRKGRTWEVAFVGSNPFKIPGRLDGMFYIHELISHPYRNIDALELYRMRQIDPGEKLKTYSGEGSGSPTGLDRAINQRAEKWAVNPDPDMVTHEDEDPSMAEDFGNIAIDPDTFQKVFDEKYLEDLKERFTDLEERIASANAREDIDEEAKLEFEKSFILAEISFEYQGREKKFKLEIKNAADSIRNAIDRAYERMKIMNPDLVKYFIATIERGYSYSFNPQKSMDFHDIEWKLNPFSD